MGETASDHRVAALAMSNNDLHFNGFTALHDTLTTLGEEGERWIRFGESIRENAVKTLRHRNRRRRRAYWTLRKAGLPVLDAIVYSESRSRMFWWAMRNTRRIAHGLTVRTVRKRSPVTG